ncbi:nitroreductase [Chloroflexota bacterium]
MDILEAIVSRKSIRGFKPAPVPEEILREIINIARRSPSSMNTQPWNITIITGETLDNIRQGNIEMLTSGVTPNPDVPSKPLEEKYSQRHVEHTIQLFKLMGLEREDKKKREEWRQRGFRFFDAPAVMILSVDKSLEKLHAHFDSGIIAQTICLVALAHDLGTCIIAQGVMFPEVVRRFTRIPKSRRIVNSIAIGYPDLDFPANKLESKREPIESFITPLAPTHTGT